MAIFCANMLWWFVAVGAEPFFTLILLMIADTSPGHGGSIGSKSVKVQVIVDSSIYLPMEPIVAHVTHYHIFHCGYITFIALPLLLPAYN